MGHGHFFSENFPFSISLEKTNIYSSRSYAMIYTNMTLCESYARCFKANVRARRPYTVTDFWPWGLEVIIVLLLKLSIKMQHRKRYLFLSIRSAITFHNSHYWVERHAVVIFCSVSPFESRIAWMRFGILIIVRYITSTATFSIANKTLAWNCWNDSERCFVLIDLTFHRLANWSTDVIVANVARYNDSN